MRAGGLASAPRSVWPLLLLLGGLSYLFFASYIAALRTIPVWEALLMFLGVPVAATFLSWVWLREAPTALQWLGMLLVSAGAAGVIVMRRPRQARGRAKGRRKRC